MNENYKGNPKPRLNTKTKLGRVMKLTSIPLFIFTTGVYASVHSPNMRIKSDIKIIEKPSIVSTPQQNTRQITGTVIDATGMPIIGANVMVKGTTNGTITDIDGKFTLEVAKDAILQVSYIGYMNQEISVGNKSVLSISLQEDTQKLDEVVVIGYGTQKKVNLTGAVASVKMDEVMGNRPLAQAADALQGTVPGLLVSSSGNAPGQGKSFQIRGAYSVGVKNSDGSYGNTISPLVLIDNVEGDLDMINPEDIETMSVLKDASAAIYGAQAANGVILITTKRGKAGKPRVGFTYNYGIAAPTVIPEMTNAVEYATLMNEIDKYAGNKGRYTVDDLRLYADGSDPWGHPDTDWFNETLKSWSPQTYANATIDGGTENVKYFVSVSAKGQDAFYRHSGSNYHQYDLKMNLDMKINKYVDTYVNVTGRMEDRKYPTRSAENIFRMLMRSKPNSPAYWPDGGTRH